MKQKESQVKINMDSRFSNKQSIHVENIYLNGFHKKPYSSNYRTKQLQTGARKLDTQKSQFQLKMAKFMQYCSGKDPQKILVAYRQQALKNQKLREGFYIQQQQKLQYLERYRQEQNKRAQLEKINENLKNQLSGLYKMTEKQNINQDNLKCVINCTIQQMESVKQQNQQQNNQIIKLNTQIAGLEQNLQILKTETQKNEKQKEQMNTKLAQNINNIENKVQQLKNVNQALQRVQIQLQISNQYIRMLQEQIEKFKCKIMELQHLIQQMQKNNAIKIKSDQQALRLGLYQNSMPIELKQQHLLEKQKKLKKLADQLYFLAQKVEKANNIVL